MSQFKLLRFQLWAGWGGAILLLLSTVFIDESRWRTALVAGCLAVGGSIAYMRLRKLRQGDSG